jgi:hypothetical protein
MAAAGGAASIITQVQQTGGPPINALGGMMLQILRHFAIKFTNIIQKMLAQMRTLL